MLFCNAINSNTSRAARALSLSLQNKAAYSARRCKSRCRVKVSMQESAEG